MAPHQAPSTSAPSAAIYSRHESPGLPQISRRGRGACGSAALRRRVGRGAEARRPHRHAAGTASRDLLPAAPGRAGRGRLALRRRQPHARRRRRAWSPRARPRRRSRAPTATTARCSRRRTSTSCSSRTPDHWHALPMIEAVEVRRWTSTSRSRSASTSSKARRCSPRRASTSASCRSARSGAARRISSTARDRIIQRGQARQDRPRRDLLLLPHARDGRIRPTRAPPAYLDYEMWTGPAPMRPYNELVHPRGWRAFMEYGNGIVGDMCIHMLDMVRWMLDLGWPTRISSSGGILVDKSQQGEHHRHADRDVRLRRTAGRLDAPHVGRSARSEVSVGRDVLRRQGHAQGERVSATTSRRAARRQRADPRGRDATSSSSSPRTRPRRTSRSTWRRPSAAHMKDFLECIEHARQAGRRHRARLHLDDGVHPGEHLDEARPVAGLGSREGRRDRRRRSELACCAAPYRAPWVHPDTARRVGPTFRSAIR